MVEQTFYQIERDKKFWDDDLSWKRNQSMQTLAVIMHTGVTFIQWGDQLKNKM